MTRKDELNGYLRKDERIGVELPAAPAKGAVFLPEKFMETCSMFRLRPGGRRACGRAGWAKEVTVEQGQVCARACMLNVLRWLEKAVGGICAMQKRCKITTFVQSADDFHEQPAVANGGTSVTAGTGRVACCRACHRRERAAGQHPRGNGSVV